MPELPDILVYQEALERHFAGSTLTALDVMHPFLVRTVSPPIKDAVGRRFVGFSHLGKRLVLEFEDELFVVIHLMIAGRLKLRGAGANRAAGCLAVFRTAEKSLMLTEAGKKRRASLRMVQGRDALREHDPGGIEPLDCTLEAFATALCSHNQTVKRALTDPHVFSGIGNAYSDEILFAAKMSPYKPVQNIDAQTMQSLFDATRGVLSGFLGRIRDEVGDGFPEKVTAFRDDFNVHGRYKKPCNLCGKNVQRIRRAESEMNYCAVCQTGGKLLSDRSLARLLKNDWQKTLEM